MIKKTLVSLFFFLSVFQDCSTASLAQQFKDVGYIEICDKTYGSIIFDSFYALFEEFIELLQANPAWAQELYRAKERFIRSKDQHYYSTDVFGFYDESLQEERRQISFYYSIHFHKFIELHYSKILQISQINRFFQVCFEIQRPCRDIFIQAAIELGLETVFSSEYRYPPVLLKVVKYLPAYRPVRPHYDGTIFSLLVDSTDNQSLLFSSYKSLLLVDDFCPSLRSFSRHAHQQSMLLIPGTQLTEYSIYPTPHIVVKSGKTRYATVAFAMRPHYFFQKNELAFLPFFNVE